MADGLSALSAQTVPTKPNPHKRPAKESSVTALREGLGLPVESVKGFRVNFGFVEAILFELQFDFFDHSTVSTKIKSGVRIQIIKLADKMLNVAFFSGPRLRRSAEHKLVLKISHLLCQSIKLGFVIHFFFIANSEKHSVAEVRKKFFF